jgi:hypothetical protein
MTEAPFLVNARSGTYHLFGKYLKQRVMGIQLHKFRYGDQTVYQAVDPSEKVYGNFYRYISQNPEDAGRVTYVPEKEDATMVESPPVSAGGMKRKRTLRKRRV